jgi:hypothetical protein
MFVVHAAPVACPLASMHLPTSVVVVVVVVLVVVTAVLAVVVGGVVVVGIGWHLQLLSQVEVAGHPDPSHSSFLPGSIWPSPQTERLACSVCLRNFFAFTATDADRQPAGSVTVTRTFLKLPGPQVVFGGDFATTFVTPFLLTLNFPTVSVHEPSDDCPGWSTSGISAAVSPVKVPILAGSR